MPLIGGPKIEQISEIAPLWQYVSRYLFALTFSSAIPNEADRDRLRLANAAVDMALVCCGYESGAFNMKDEDEIRTAAEEVMKRLPPQL